MKKILNIFLLTIIAIGLIQCSGSSDPEDKAPPRELTIAEKEIVSSAHNFGLKLFRELISEESDTNVFISPLSVSMALGMTYNGAAGTTREAMQKTLELNGLSIQEINESYQSLIKLLTELDKKVIFQIANSIWYLSVAVIFFGNFLIGMRVMAKSVFGKPNDNVHYIDVAPKERLLHLAIFALLLVLSAVGLKELLS